MADSAMVAAITGVASALAGAALTYVTTISKIRQDLVARYDADLRHARIVVYRKLWRKLQPLATYAPERDLTYNDAHDLATSLRSWYFEVGGLFLSQPARDAYFALQKGLATVKEISDMAVPLEMLEMLIQRGSALRTQLTQDVGTRAQPMFREAATDEASKTTGS